MNTNATLDGDRSFQGVDMRREAGTLEAGLAGLARNARFRKGKAETRPGIVKLKWTHHKGAPFPFVFDPTSYDQTVPFVTVYGAGRFDDPNGVEWIFIAGSRLEAEGKVWVTRPNNSLIEEPLPDGETITGPVTFVQAVDQVFLFRGEDAAPLVLIEAGTGKGFRALTLSETDTAAGLSLIPNAERALFFQNRLIVPHGRDLLDVSDALDPEHVFQATSRFRINQGSSDRLTGVYKFNDDTLICAKEESIYALTGLTPDENGRFSSAQLDAVTTSFGFVAGKSVVQVGSDLIGLSQFGVMSIRQTEQNKLQSVVMPLSAAIQPLIDRINWKYASQACGAYWDSKYYLAVPLDDAEKEGNNIVPAGLTYPGDGSPAKIAGLEPGRKYRVRFGINDAIVDAAGDDGQVEFAAGASNQGGDFVAGIVTDGPDSSSWIKFTPLDGQDGQPVTATVTEIYSGVNNAVLVFDFVNGAWCGSDDGPGLMVTDFITLVYLGRQRLFFMSPDGFLNLYEEGFEDEIYQWTAYVPGQPRPDFVGVIGQEVEFELLTRGYGLMQEQNDGKSVARLGEVRAAAATVALATWDPEFSISEVPVGVGEEQAAVANVTRDGTRYATFGIPRYNPLNDNDDHANPGREDYSVALPESSGILLGSGIDLELMQDSLQRVRLHGRGNYVQLRILNTRGRMEVKRVEMESVAARRRFGVKW